MTSEYECPVCHEDYTEPKLLPCAHLACRKCIISWLEKGAHGGGCPLCRAPILSPTHRGQCDLATQVDALPTDLASMALVESHKVLRSPNICAVCENNAEATSYCFQCNVKLCQTCVKHHRNIPATQNHTHEQLSSLSANQLAKNRPLACNTHPDRLAELYCSQHQQSICILCGTTSHGDCKGKKTIRNVAAETREELTQCVQRLKKKETEISTQVRFDPKPPGIHSRNALCHVAMGSAYLCQFMGYLVENSLHSGHLFDAVSNK